MLLYYPYWDVKLASNANILLSLLLNSLSGQLVRSFGVPPSWRAEYQYRSWFHHFQTFIRTELLTYNIKNNARFVAVSEENNEIRSSLFNSDMDDSSENDLSVRAAVNFPYKNE